MLWHLPSRTEEDSTSRGSELSGRTNSKSWLSVSPWGCRHATTRGCSLDWSKLNHNHKGPLWKQRDNRPTASAHIGLHLIQSSDGTTLKFINWSSCTGTASLDLHIHKLNFFFLSSKSVIVFILQCYGAYSQAAVTYLLIFNDFIYFVCSTKDIDIKYFTLWIHFIVCILFSFLLSQLI